LYRGMNTYTLLMGMWLSATTSKYGSCT
jgi:hypothetical protein